MNTGELRIAWRDSLSPPVTMGGTPSRWADFFYFYGRSAWVKILKVPYPILFPLILLFCLIGCYSLNNTLVEVLIMVIFGFIGYGFKKFEYEGAPLVLALVLGPMMETALRRSLLLSAGDPLIFLTRPISAALMLISLFLLAYPLFPWRRKKRAIPPAEEKED